MIPALPPRPATTRTPHLDVLMTEVRALATLPGPSVGAPLIPRSVVDTVTALIDALVRRTHSSQWIRATRAMPIGGSSPGVLLECRCPTYFVRLQVTREGYGLEHGNLLADPNTLYATQSIPTVLQKLQALLDDHFPNL